MSGAKRLIYSVVPFVSKHTVSWLSCQGAQKKCNGLPNRVHFYVFFGYKYPVWLQGGSGGGGGGGGSGGGGGVLISIF